MTKDLYMDNCFTATAAYPTCRSGLKALTPRGANGSYIAAAIKQIHYICHPNTLFCHREANTSCTSAAIKIEHMQFT